MNAPRYPAEHWTYGAELELADVWIKAPLPPANGWNEKDYTIVNSNGIANDPSGELYLYGGEINTRPTTSIDGQLGEIAGCLEAVARVRQPAINYRCNLHIHVGIPSLLEDLKALKRLNLVVHQVCPIILPVLEPIPKPTKAEYPTPDSYGGAVGRYKRRKVSHQGLIAQKLRAAVQSASTVEQFFAAQAPTCRKTGRPLWHLAPRPAVNLRQLMETGTIEFRHFPGTLSMESYQFALEYCKLFLEMALDGSTPQQMAASIVPQYAGKFPAFEPYQHRLELIYRYTSMAHNRREVLRQRFRGMSEADLIRAALGEDRG